MRLASRPGAPESCGQRCCAGPTPRPLQLGPFPSGQRNHRRRTASRTPTSHGGVNRGMPTTTSSIYLWPTKSPPVSCSSPTNQHRLSPERYWSPMADTTCPRFGPHADRRPQAHPRPAIRTGRSRLPADDGTRRYVIPGQTRLGDAGKCLQLGLPVPALLPAILITADSPAREIRDPSCPERSHTLTEVCCGN